MKKLFIAAMALATIVSCSKDEGVDEVLTSGKKAVAIQITNAATSTTRADFTEGDTAIGQNEPCAKASELTVLFANNAGQVVEFYDLTAGASTTTDYEIEDDDDDVTGVTYMFHGVDQSVTQVAVVRLDKTLDSDITIAAGTELSTLKARAESLEKNNKRAVTQIALYGVDESLNNTGKTHTGSPVNKDNNTHATGEETTYLVYTAHVEVAPAFARIEVTGISCYDLGDENKDDDLVTGYDEMILNSFTFTNSGSNYSLAAIEKTKWYGSYKYATDADGTKTWAAATESSIVRSKTPEKGAWSWNVKSESAWSDMTLKLTVDAADYKVQVPGRDLIIGDLKYTGSETDPTALGSLGFTKNTVDGKDVYYLSTYKKNHIYRMNIPFSETDLEDVNEAMCVSVTVDIVNWVVVPVKPVFGN